ncbi:MAG: phytanoyl-CoA dioxygenase family protein [Sneathiellales bacterium]|nr:phytanoyl-CoA dioxygenase family protein [Sneathiellales bacterium]
MNKSLRNLALLPVWILSIFSKSKSFGENPVVGSYILNLLGLHVFRLLLAHGISNFRFFLLSPLMPKEERKRFHEDGYIVLKDFLPEEEFAALQHEAIQYSGQVAEKIEGDTATDWVRLSPDKCKELPACKRMLDVPGYRKRLQYCAATLRPPLYYIQAIRHNYVSGEKDPQKDVHSDTFHPTMKAWFYMVDVTPENGPFKYIKGSHKLSWSKIKWEYRKSLREARAGTDGSFRATEEDLKELGYDQPKAVCVPRNTLVIVNTHGYHCRGQANGAQTRVEIWAFSRVNPFNPFLGLSVKLLEKVRHKIIDKLTDHQSKSGKLKVVTANWSSEFKQDAK